MTNEGVENLTPPFDTFDTPTWTTNGQAITGHIAGRSVIAIWDGYDGFTWATETDSGHADTLDAAKAAAVASLQVTTALTAAHAEPERGGAAAFLDELDTETRRCRVCGCTDDYACDGGCWWVDDDLCSACVPPRPAPGACPDCYAVGGHLLGCTSEDTRREVTGAAGVDHLRRLELDAERYVPSGVLLGGALRLGEAARLVSRLGLPRDVELPGAGGLSLDEEQPDEEGGDIEGQGAFPPMCSALRLLGHHDLRAEAEDALASREAASDVARDEDAFDAAALVEEAYAEYWDALASIRRVVELRGALVNSLHAVAPRGYARVSDRYRAQLERFDRDESDGRSRDPERAELARRYWRGLERLVGCRRRDGGMA